MRPKEEERIKMEEKAVKKPTLSLREVQAMLMRKTLSPGGRGGKMAALLMKHINEERKKLLVPNSTSTSSSVQTSVKTFHSQKGEYSIHIGTSTADGQAGGGGGAETIQVMFTPTICKVRCIQDRCVNYCKRGNVTTVYSSNEATGGRNSNTDGPGFRVFLCPLLCKNGGICLQKDRCLCPPNFTGKFCQIPVAPTVSSDPALTATSSSSINEIVKPALLSSMAANQNLTQSEFLLPLVQGQERGMPGAPSPRMVKVRVEHPPEASVKVHQVLKVSGFSPTFRSLSSSSHSGSAGAPAPAPAPAPHAGGSRGVQAQTIRGGGTYTHYSGFKYCFREVKDGQCSSPLPGLRSKDTCCRGLGKAWGITDCVLCPPTSAFNSSCPVGFDKGNGTQCQDVNECLESGLCENGFCVNTRGSYSCVCRAGFILDASHGICISHNVISEEKGQCYRVLGSGLGPSSCSLPILRNITKQICCCSRVGKAWGPDCQRCPYFGSVAFKDICPAGPGYHYSASALQFNQRVSEHLGSRGAVLVTPSHQDKPGPGSGSSGASRSQQNPSSSSSDTSLSSASGVGSSAGSGGSVIGRSGPPQPPPGSRPATKPAQAASSGTTTPRRPEVHQVQQVQPETRPAQTKPPPASTGVQGIRPHAVSPGGDAPPTLPHPQSPDRGDAPPTLPHPQSPDRGDDPPTLPRPQSPDWGDAPPTLPRPKSPDRGDAPLTLPRPQSPDREDTPPTLPRPQSPDWGDASPTLPRPKSPDRGDDPPTLSHPQSPDWGSPPTGEAPPLQRRPPVIATVRPPRVQTMPRVCEIRPGVCGRGRCVDQPGGKHTCVCDQGFQPNAQRTICQDMNECAHSPGVCSKGECVNTAGSYRCVCPSGYRSVSQQTGCHDIDECVQNLCRNGRCENTPGSYRCICRHGYKLSGNTCTDVDECAEPLQCPGQECINSQGSYRCVSCQSGYGLLNRVCTDMDECLRSPCSNGHCENTPGSYRCVCHHGYKLLNNTCTDVDECAEPSQCPGQMCVNSMGSYRCVSCRPGYTLTNRHCTDVDECQAVGACEAGRECVNTVGSFRCECPPGFRTAALRRTCTDINECLEGDFCFPRGECVNADGSYTCVCSHGFTLSANGTACLDVDECSRPAVCVDGRCVNTDGSFQCQCQTGFVTNPEKTACLDVDECVSSSGSVCGSQRCENTIGSFRCLTSCDPGYQVLQSGTCVDVNECSNKTVCGEHAFCQNLIGTYVCVCDQGFTATADGKACVDENECVSLPDVCGSARCENVEGSFMCECERPGEEYDNTARKCITPALPAGMLPSSSSSSSSSPSSSFHVSVVEMMLPPLPAARPGELRECYYNLMERGTCSLLATNTSQQECCCTVGEAWGLGCQYHTCPPIDTADFLSLCPNGRGYVSTGAGAFSYRDVDECKRFHPEVCKNGVCVNNIPGYNCYCSSGYVYNNTLLECVDHDECEEETCIGGVCVNTVGSYYCSCPHPLVLDDTQRNCVNSSHLTVDENLSLCWQNVNADLVCQSPLLGAQLTFMDCCCLYGDGWGMECALCPATDSDDYASLCSSVLPPLYPESYPDSPGPGLGGAGAPPYFSPFHPPDSFPPAVLPGTDYDDYSPPGGSRSAFRGRTPPTYSLPDGAYGRSEYSDGYYSEGDYGPPDGSRPPSLRLPSDPRAERAFGALPSPPSRPDGAPLSLAQLPGAPYEEHEEEEEETWRPGPPFPPFSDRRGGGGARGGAGAAPRRVYERLYESYAGLSAAEDCGILHGCENGRCIRVVEGYTCDCYQGYELDMTSMTCIDINECDGAVDLEFPCVNARCVNTDGSFRCICRRGYVLSHRPNHCVAA